MEFCRLRDIAPSSANPTEKDNMAYEMATGLI